jgi:hypothetical protein
MCPRLRARRQAGLVAGASGCAVTPGVGAGGGCRLGLGQLELGQLHWT